MSSSQNNSGYFLIQSDGQQKDIYDSERQIQNNNKRKVYDFLVQDEQNKKYSFNLHHKTKNKGQKSLFRKNRTKRWTTQQDRRLANFVKRFGTRWSQIGKMMGDKRGKSCRQRWLNKLDPRISWEKMNLYQQWLLFLGYQCFGPQWAQIAKLFSDRTDNQIKNHWNTQRMRSKVPLLKQLYSFIIIKNGLLEIVDQVVKGQ